MQIIVTPEADLDGIHEDGSSPATDDRTWRSNAVVLWKSVQSHRLVLWNLIKLGFRVIGRMLIFCTSKTFGLKEINEHNVVTRIIG